MRVQRARKEFRGSPDHRAFKARRVRKEYKGLKEYKVSRDLGMKKAILAL